MIVDPVEVLLKTVTASQVLPTATPSKVAPLPSVFPDPEPQVVGHSGVVTLWVLFVGMVIASALFAGWSLRVPVSNRVYHILMTLVTTISALTYFLMATGQGVTFKETTIRHSNDHVPDTYEHLKRQVFWVRFVEWTLINPLLLINLGILSGLSGAHILMAVVANIIMNLMGLFAAFGDEGTPQKWGNYVIAILAFLVVVWHLAVNGRGQVQAKSQKVASFYYAIAIYTIIVWAAYAVVWGIVGSRRISVNAEVITYAVLDFLAQPVFGIWLLLTHAKTPETNVDLKGFWSNGLNREGLLRLDEEDGA